LIRLTVREGELAGKTFEFASDVIRIGRAESNELRLSDDVMSGEHACIRVRPDGTVLQDVRSTNGTAILRAALTHKLDDTEGRSQPLEDGDTVVFGVEPHRVVLGVAIVEEKESAQVFALRKIADLSPALVERDQSRMSQLYAAQKRIGAAQDLNEVLLAVTEAAFTLVGHATHVTIILKDDEDDAREVASGYVPVMTRARGRQDADGKPVQDAHIGPIPITRSVFRKVIAERALVLAADAPQEVSQSESMMGAQIRSTMGVPLWRGEEILGVLQLDNREAKGMFMPPDLDVMAVLAHNASLAVANARLLQKLRTAEERLKKENAFLKGREQERRTGSRATSAPEIIGNSTAMRHLIEQLDKVVDTRVTVLIDGETGVGKELIAASVHYRSKRRDKLFIGQNCAAMPENLLESELFGHRKGSFTGATDEKKGLFEIADGGTLFLDEITETPLSLQSKLLRVLQEGEIRPIGATQEKKVNVRIVAATNRNLEKEVAEGRFREDLYYRLKVFPLRVPPLRERREDIPLLANYFLVRFCKEMGKTIAGFSQQALELLQAYKFPGNVRELQNEVQRLIIQVDEGGFITPELLSPRVREVEGMIERVKPQKGTLKEMMDQLERFLLIESLRENQNNKTASAKVLGITREGLHKKLRQFGL
jgi:transcriptional regulator with GAF, ATPase, and Fis domain